MRSRNRLAWFTKARFGVFVHYGLYSYAGRGEWVMYAEDIPFTEYRALVKRFRPRDHCASEWVRLARDAGARYVILTARHHDGFCLFNSTVSNFNSAHCWGIDLVEQFVAACARYRMKVGLYYSLSDWRLPAYFRGPRKKPLRRFDSGLQYALHSNELNARPSRVYRAEWKTYRDYLYAQVRELMTNYGRIDILWYDGNWPIPYTPAEWGARRISSMARRLQPQILINDRWGIGGNDTRDPWGDFDTCEQTINPVTRPWESCTTMNDHWGYVPSDREWKTSAQLIRNLVQCAAYGGNYLLNLGPRPDGSVPAPSRHRLETIGDWLRRQGDSIYGTMADVDNGAWRPLRTRKERRIYVHVFNWPGTELCLGRLKDRVMAASLLERRTKLKIARDEQGRLVVNGLPVRPPDRYDNVVVLRIAT